MSTATAEKSNGSHVRANDVLDAALSETEKQMLLRPELVQMKMENETIMAECRIRPRDMKVIRKQLSDLLEEFPEFASEAIYCKPVGSDDGGNQQQKYAKGLSIRAAEALAEAYGYNRVRADVTEIDDFKVKVDATFTDFQTGRIWQDGGIVSKFYTQSKKRGGGRATHSDDRFYNVIVKSEKSKYLREVICRSVNSALKAWFESKCAEVSGSLITPADIDKAVAGWKKLGVELSHLEQAVGTPREMGWTKEDLVLLRGLWTAIKDGETTLQEAFGIQGTGAAKQPEKPTGPVSAGDLVKTQPWEEFLQDHHAATEIITTRAAYDKWGTELTPEQSEEARKLTEAKEESIRAGRGGRKGQLLAE